MTGPREDEPRKPRRITISPRLRIGIAVTGGVLAGLAWWGLAPGDDDSDDNEGQQTEHVHYEDED